MADIAAEVDADVQSLTVDSRLSQADAALLAALNAVDRARKSADSADHLRLQIKTYLDETQKLKSELAEARRELSRVKKQV